MSSSESKSAKNIVYAEDNPDDAAIFEIAFQRSGLPHRLYFVEDGTQAIAWLQGEDGFAERAKHPLPDVLILDLKMPKKSGFDVLKWLRESKQFDHVQTIILSSSDDPKDKQRAEELGVTTYFMKSALYEDVIEYLQALS